MVFQHFFVFTASKKLAPVPPKITYTQTGAVSDQSTGQPSPVSLSPTPPSTPSPYGLSYQGSLSLTPNLASPPSVTSTLTKARPTPKPRQRPSLPPPQPPSQSASSPQSSENSILDGLSPGDSMSTGKQISFSVPPLERYILYIGYSDSLPYLIITNS